MTSLLRQITDYSNRANPYPLYAELRKTPVARDEDGPYVISTYHDIQSLLHDPRISSEARNLSAPVADELQQTEEETSLPPGFLRLDPPEHDRLRRMTNRPFGPPHSPRRIEGMRPELGEIVSGLIDGIANEGRIDLVDQFSYPFPVTVICRLLGVPVEDEPKFGHASTLLAQTVDPFLTATGDVPEGFTDRIEAGKWLRKYFRELISRRRSSPGDDLISALIAVEESGDQLSEDEIISTCNLLLIAGHESTVSLMATSVLAMLRNRTQWAMLGANPSRALRVIEETLRFDPPAQLLGRVAAEEMRLGNTVIPEGDTMIVLLAAAHRDPAANDNPDVFDPDRATIRHLGFGHGAHFCLGAPLVRLEASIALTAVTKRFPNAQLGGDPQYKPNVTLRGMLSLPVSVSG